jgi:hypothetical protein
MLLTFASQAACMTRGSWRDHFAARKSTDLIVELRANARRHYWFPHAQRAIGVYGGADWHIHEPAMSASGLPPLG